MKENNITKIINTNREKLPLSFYDLEFKTTERSTNPQKIVFSKKFKDSNFSIYRFYKPITRF